MEDFLSKSFHTEKGRAVALDGTYVGEHHGALVYTIGERVALTGTLPGPWYVLSKDIVKNELVVGHTCALATPTYTIRLSSVNILEPISETTVYQAQYRYHGPSVSVTYNKKTEEVSVVSGHTEPFVAGQSLVLYQNDVVVVGGIIEE